MIYSDSTHRVCITFTFDGLPSHKRLVTEEINVKEIRQVISCLLCREFGYRRELWRSLSLLGNAPFQGSATRLIQG